MVAWKTSSTTIPRGQSDFRGSNDLSEPKLRKDLRRLAVFIELFCDDHHGGLDRAAVSLKNVNVSAIARHPLVLCAECTRLLTHAFVKRTHCPLNPKPACKHCPEHCYHPDYRARIREVMRYSGRQMLFRGRLDFLFHLLF